jgi:hypothetical protein
MGAHYDIAVSDRQLHYSTYQLNLFLFNQDIPEEARPIVQEPMLTEVALLETYIGADGCSDDIKSTAIVVHANKYNATMMMGFFKTFRSLPIVACVIGYGASPIDAA